MDHLWPRFVTAQVLVRIWGLVSALSCGQEFCKTAPQARCCVFCALFGIFICSQFCVPAGPSGAAISLCLHHPTPTTVLVTLPGQALKLEVWVESREVVTGGAQLAQRGARGSQHVTPRGCRSLVVPAAAVIGQRPHRR